MAILVGRKAPAFFANAVIDKKIVPNFGLEQYMGKKYVVFFFYPKDFTFVCPTEIVAFQKAIDDFQSRDVQIVGCSTDSEFSHLAWENTPRDKGGIDGVTYPLVSDINKTISSAYGVLAGEVLLDPKGVAKVVGEQIAYRGLFLIDKNGIVQHEVVNNFPLGRSIDEEIRMVDALQHFEQFGEVCPMNWHKGDPAMKPSAASTAEYLAKSDSAK